MNYREFIEDVTKMAEGLKYSQVVKLTDEIEADDTVLMYLDRLMCQIKEDAYHNGLHYTEVKVVVMHELPLFDDAYFRKHISDGGWDVISYESNPEAKD
jgi:hypothetical protein